MTFAGALGMQTLIGARRTWQADGQPFEIVAPSAALTSACRQLGLREAEIGIATMEEG